MPRRHLQRRCFAVLATFAVALPTALSAQEPKAPASAPKVAPEPSAPPRSQAELQKLRAQKLAKPVFHSPEWLLDYASARAASARTGKPIFALFTRSYAACPPCEALEDGPLAEPAFAAFAERVVLFLHVSSRVDGEPEPHLLRDQGFTGFPTLCFLGADGALLAEQEERTVASFAATLQQLEQLTALIARAQKGEDVAVARFLLETELGRHDAAAIRKALAELLFDATQRAVLDTRLVDADLRDLMAHRREYGDAKYETQLLALVRSGRKPSPRLGVFFWGFALEHAAKAKDAALAEQAWTELAPQKLAPVARERFRKLLAEAKGDK